MPDKAPVRKRINGFTCFVPSNLANVDEICDRAHGLLEKSGLVDRKFDVDLLLREFVTNAMEHGNDMDRKKRVGVDFRIGAKWIVLRISDEGPGFPWRTQKSEVPDDNATSGRGLAIGALYAQRLRYNRAGNQVTLWISKTRETEGERQ